MPPAKRPTVQWTEADLPELQQARYYWENDQPGKALELFERTAKKHPRNLMALLDAARALGSAHRLPEAAALLKRAGRVLEQSSQGLERLGQSYRMAYMPDIAAEYFTMAVKDPNCLESVIELTMYHERRHQLDLAVSVLAPALALHPDLAPLKLLGARLDDRRGQEEEAKRKYCQVAEDQHAHPYHRAQACYELANIADRQEDFREAYQYACKAKELMRPLANGLAEQSDLWRARHQSLIHALNPELVTKWQEEVPQCDRFSVFLTGCPRSGTTLLERVLGAHPQIQSFDELDIFPRFLCGALFKNVAQEARGVEALESCSGRNLDELRERYWKLFGNHQKLGSEVKVLLDKNPSASGSVPAYLKLFPYSKILFALRDPRDIAISCFLRFLPMNSVSASFLEPEKTVEYIREELQMGLELRNRIPAGQWAEVRYESVVEDLAGTAEHTLHTLGLEWRGEVAEYRSQNQKREVNSPTYLEVTKPIHQKSKERWKNYGFAFDPYFESLGDLLSDLGYQS